MSFVPRDLRSVGANSISRLEDAFNTAVAELQSGMNRLYDEIVNKKAGIYQEERGALAFFGNLASIEYAGRQVCFPKYSTGAVVHCPSANFPPVSHTQAPFVESSNMDVVVYWRLQDTPSANLTFTPKLILSAPASAPASLASIAATTKNISSGADPSIVYSDTFAVTPSVYASSQALSYGMVGAMLFDFSASGGPVDEQVCIVRAEYRVRRRLGV